MLSLQNITLIEVVTVFEIESFMHYPSQKNAVFLLKAEDYYLETDFFSYC